MSVSWAQPDVSSTRVRMGRRRFVTKESPTAAASFRNHARLASIAIHSVGSAALNAQASTTWVPCVLTMRTCWPARTPAAIPRRAGIVTRSGTEALLVAAQAVAAPIVGDGGRAPVAEQGGLRLPDLHPQGPADGEGVAGVRPPHRHREVAVRADRDRAQDVDLGEALEEVAAPGRTRLDEVAALRGEAGDLEDVEHVVDVPLREVVGPHRAHEVTVAAEIELLPVEQLVHVGVAAGSQEVVAAAAVRVAAVLDGVGGDREHGPQVRQARPEAVEGREVRLVELSGPRGPEALARIGEAPHVEVRDLGALDGNDAEDLSRSDGPRPPRAPRHDEALDQRPRAGLAREARVELAVDFQRGPGLRLVDHAR